MTATERSAQIEAEAAMVLTGFDKGIFGRNTTNDHRADWAIHAFAFIAALARLKRLIDTPEEAK